jgi:beta-glucosidase
VDVEERIESLCKELTVEEKVALLAGADLWRTPGAARLGIPTLKMTDGPSGARGGTFGGEVTSASFPCGSALAATWNVALVEAVGEALGEEARSKGCQVLLGPTVNLQRHPLGGRHFECYSEDPLLSAEIAVAWIRGVQRRRVACCVKHYVANDTEQERNTQSSDVPERALRELYLLPFEHAVKRAGAWSLMSAYNKVDGVWCAENPLLLREVLKKDWGFDGAVVSDWYGSHEDSARGGLDVEMPGPPRHFGAKLLEAVRSGEVAEAHLDEMVRRVLRLALRTGGLEQAGAEPPERAEDRPEHRVLARRAAAEAIVLLRNEGRLLPLVGGPDGGLRRLAVIGPNARYTATQGGGSARVNPHYTVSALEGIRRRAEAAGIEVSFAAGCTSHEHLPPPDPAWLAPGSGEGPGLRVEYRNGLSFGAPPALVRTERRLEFHWFGPFASEVDAGSFCARLSGTFTPPESGAWSFSLTSAGKSRLRLDGRELVDNWTRQTRGDSFFGLGSAEVAAQVELEAGRAYAVEIDYAREGAPFVAGLRVGCLPPVPEGAIARAAELARDCDAAVVVVGTNGDWETEGHDRRDLALPGRQAELVAAVAAAQARTIVALNTGAPVELPFLERVAAALQSWFGGQEAGNALADVLFGDADPGGRLPTTYPRRIEDTPAYLHYPPERGRMLYGEGLHVGYRWYDARRIEPAFAFGHGLSYARFEYGDARARVEEEAGPEGGVSVHVIVDVTNVSDRAGLEVVQLYVADPEASVARPPQELRAFAKVALAPGERRTVRLPLGVAALSFWDPARRAWVAEAGEYEARIGRSSRDLRAAVRFRLAQEHVAGPEREL